MSLRAADPRLSLRVGAVVLLVLALAVVWVLFLKDRLFLGPSVEVRVYFEHVGSLREGAPVIVAGRQVGEVESIALVPRERLGPDHPLAATGGVEARVTIAAARAHMVPVDGDWFVSSRGVLSERYLEVGPPAGGGAPGRPVRDGDAVVASSPPSMDRVIQTTWDNLTIARAFLEEVRPEAGALFAEIRALSETLAALEPRPGEWTRLRDNVARAAGEAEIAWVSLVAAGARPEQVNALIGRARRTIAQLGVATQLLRRQLGIVGDEVARVRAQVDAAAPGLEARLRAGLEAADRALAKLDALRAKADDLLALLARGEGTIGRLQNDPEFPEDAKELGRILKNRPWRIVGHPQDDP